MASRPKAWPVVFDGDALIDLRPRQGNSSVRPIYARLGSRFVVLAVAAKKSGFDRAVTEAQERFARHL